jgi:hypothetical protein
MREIKEIAHDGHVFSRIKMKGRKLAYDVVNLITVKFASGWSSSQIR